MGRVCVPDLRFFPPRYRPHFYGRRPCVCKLIELMKIWGRGWVLPDVDLLDIVIPLEVLDLV
jgi:hypothetical protein